MRAQRFGVVAGFVIGLLPVVALAAPQILDYLAPPPSLKEMWQTAEVVAHIKVLTVGPATADSPGPRPLVVHHDTAQVLEVLKHDGGRAESSTINIQQFGGTVVIQGKDVTTQPPAPLLEPDAEAIVFLHGASGVEYSIEWGSGGLFLVNAAAGTVAVPEPVANHVADFARRPWVPLDELLSKLRTIRDKRP